MAAERHAQHTTEVGAILKCAVREDVTTYILIYLCTSGSLHGVTMGTITASYIIIMYIMCIYIMYLRT